MPIATQHAARQADPAQFRRFRQGKLSNAPVGVSVVLGVRDDGKADIQSVRFDSKKWSVERARKWLKEHGFKTKLEPSSAKERWQRAVKIEKVVPEQRLAFGWLYTANDKHARVADPEHIAADGTVVDHSREMIEPAELEKASYAYVKDSRAGRVLHDGVDIATLVECVVFTAEKRAMMGIPDDAVPDAMWVGYYVEDDAAWSRVKSGELSELSLGGSALREEL